MTRTFERILIEHCAPTLAKLKTGSLFNYQIRAYENIDEYIEYWNNLLIQKGVCVTVLAKYENRALVYVYRKKSLAADLKNPRICSFLNTFGYDTGSVEGSISVLKDRLVNCPGFPHEIGLFLGYPLHDVVGFIENNGKNFCCCGCWKVYEDHCAAQKCFMKFKKCKSVYLDLFIRGKSILQLTVAA
jgi:hypothetical protein